jgi:hypothetical protein
LTKRSFIIGLLMSIFVSLWPPYSTYVIQSIRADYAHISTALLIPLVPLLLINRALSQRIRLTGSELILIVSMGMVAALSQGEYLSAYFLGVVSAPTYFASAENGWAEALLTRLPSWTIVEDHKAVVAFYEGLPHDAAFPWFEWGTPLLWWGGLFLAITLANLYIVVIFRRQWMEHERLPYPLATGLLELTGEGDQLGTLTALFANRRFQIGFLIVFLPFIWEIASWFTILIPPIAPTTDRVLSFARGFPNFMYKLNPVTVAFGYFTESTVLFSIWFFYALSVLQAGTLTRLGFEMGSPDLWCAFHPALGWQSFGSLIVLVLSGIWVGRDHLRAVCRKAFKGDPSVDDSEEIVTYRGAVLGLIGCSLYCFFFFWHAGMALFPLLAFWFATAVLYLGLARIIVETGLIFMRTPITAQAFTWHIFGLPGLGPVGATALGLSYSFFADGKTFGITTIAHIPRLGMGIQRARRRLVSPTIGLAFICGTLAVWVYTLYEGNYGVGSYNFGSVSFNGSGDGAAGIWAVAAGRVQTSEFVTDWKRIGWMGFGILFTLLLTALRHRFPGFKLHPLGFAISASGVMMQSFVSLFAVWLAKVLIFRLGGLGAYRRNIPLFMGFLMGYLAAMALIIVVDFIWFKGQGKGMYMNGW